MLKQESGTSTPSSEPQDGSGYLTNRTEEFESSLGSTSSGNDPTLTEDTISDASLYPQKQQCAFQNYR